jgi:hypothetical protein
VRTAAGVPAGRISDVEIVEEGKPPEHLEATLLGGLTVRFEH